MTTRLLLTRHGNTFRPGDTPRRIGARTDLPLVETELGTALGSYLKQQELKPDRVWTAPLERTMKTAELAIAEFGIDLAAEPDPRLIEIDYGPDEGMSEDRVVARIGQAALDRWNRDATPPPGWKISPSEIIKAWHDIAVQAQNHHRGQTLLIVTSNGILRFAPHLTRHFHQFAAHNDLKVSTGGLSIFEKKENDSRWTISGWNLRPQKLLGIPAA